MTFLWSLLESLAVQGHLIVAIYFVFQVWGLKYMKATYHPGIHRYALFVVCWTACLLTAGALVTSNDAALAVSDWPTSFGSFFPPLRLLTGGALIEHTHRVIGAILGVFIIILAYLLWRYDERPALKKLGFVALAGVIVQGILGGLTVLNLLHYWLPVMHACTAELEFAILVAIAFFTSRWYMQDLPQYADSNSPSIHSIATINAVVIFFQVLLGAGYRHHYISYVPHLFGALVVLATVMWTAGTLRRRFPEVAAIARARVFLHALVGLQIILGLGSLWARITTLDAPQPMPVMIGFTVVHTVAGAFLFATSIVTVLLCYRLVPRKREVLFATTKGEVPA
ncbi:MAG TPA: COX15/CtaA family protein [Candidatus Sulfotelmatobacter sp.]|nr:COX15/CtaA family protein [Candidatus Sulfotelmatobacter sp.]